MDTKIQPTVEQLESALNDLAQVLGIAGAEAESYARLAHLRRIKTTWIGKKENDLRFAIDKALES